MEIHYEELFPDELRASISRQPLAYLLLRVMKFHGWHNALWLDSLKARKICELAGTPQTSDVVLPPLSTGHNLFPWQERLGQVIEDIVKLVLN